MDHINPTPILFLEENRGNRIYIMRDDLIPFSFGGNKARKALLFFRQIDEGGYNAVVTYGSSSSNHCRIIANMASARGISCTVVSADDEGGFNRRLVSELFGAEVRICALDQVAKTIDDTVAELTRSGKKVFFIPGGGHGNTGTQAYDLAYNQIVDFCNDAHISFDYIFHASGTGTTQAGLICGKLRHENHEQKIVGISVARRNPRGGQVVSDSVRQYIGYKPKEDLIFDDSYICGGYGEYDSYIEHTIRRMITQHGLPLDPTYTGKAYAGMEHYLDDHRVFGKNILFIHTGGTPLFYDWMM